MPRKPKKATEEPMAEEPKDVTPPAAEQEAVFDELDADEEGTAFTEALPQAVTFLLDGQLYGLPIEVVQEIQQLAEFTPVPEADRALLGLVDLRGTVIPALDLRVLVGLPARPFTLETPMVFCRVRGHVVCLVVDAVEDVVDLPISGVQSASGMYALADRMLGMCRLPQGLVLLLDIERLVPDAALAAADSVGGR